MKKYINNIITIDGFSGTGKSTLSYLLSNILSYSFLDSGALYRALAVFLLFNNINICNHKYNTSKIFKRFKINFVKENNRFLCYLNDIDISNIIRSERIAIYASYIGSLPFVRKNLLHYQKKFFNKYINGLIADGRDMGAVIFPLAKFKFFLYASIYQRASRRYKQIYGSNNFQHSNFLKIYNLLYKRDYMDINRISSPLKPASDAIIIDTSNLSALQVLDFVVKCIGLR